MHPYARRWPPKSPSGNSAIRREDGAEPSLRPWRLVLVFQPGKAFVVEFGDAYESANVFAVLL
jgi:hypothetical protein